MPAASHDVVAPKPALARVGAVVRGKWRIDKLLGTGGMATVYAATHRNGTRAAIKILHDYLAREPDMQARFLREGYLANKVDHPGVVSVLDDGVDEDGTVFLVMELLDGETVEKRWERKGKRLPLSEALSITSELLAVLAVAHAQGVVHRDIKPENVFLTRDGQVRVLDFGIAGLERRVTGASTTMTENGTTMGTPAFMSPEQARGRWDEVDARSDVWAAGATLFALLAGRFVHEGETPNERLLSAMTRQAPPLAPLVPGLEPSVAAIVDRALAHRPADRWQDAQTMHAAIQAAYADLYPTESKIALPRTSAPDTDGTDVMVPLDAEAAASLVTQQGLTSGGSAAPPRSATRPRRSSFVVGLAGLAAGIALVAATQARGPASAAVSSGNANAAPSPPPAVAPEAAQAKTEPTAPAPPATGASPTLAELPPPVHHVAPAAVLHHRPAAVVSSARREPDSSASDRPAPSARPSASSEGLLDRRH